MAAPVRAPILISGSDELPDPTAEALDALDPQGGEATGGAALFAIGDVATPAAARPPRSKAGDAAARRRRSRRCATASSAPPRPHRHRPRRRARRSRCRPPPGRRAPATRSSSPPATTLPKPTVDAASKRHTKVPVYVLGPSSAISSEGRCGRSPRSAASVQPRLRRGPGRQRDRLRPLRRRRLRLERQRPRPRLRPRPRRRAARRRRRGAALGLRHLGPAAAHRQRRYPAGGAARILPRREARLHRPTRPAPSTTTCG